MFFEAYAKLVNDYPGDCDQLFGQALTADNSMWLSIDGDANPTLLFAAREIEIRNDIELQSISARFSRDCVIEAATGNVASGNYTIVRLNENDPDIVRVLLRMLSEIFQVRKSPYSNKEIAARILDVADLFKKIADSTGDAIGLWGELHILLQASHLDLAVQCWCLNKNAKYDYVTKDFVLEAKTTVLSRRKHRFSLDQLRPNSDFRVYVASLTVVELKSGRSTADLMEEVCCRLEDADLRARFLSQCLVKGGHDLYRNTLKLGLYPDGSSLVILDASIIPAPDVAPGSGIENVRFDVDLTDHSAVSNCELETVLAFGMTQ